MGYGAYVNINVVEGAMYSFNTCDDNLSSKSTNISGHSSGNVSFYNNSSCGIKSSVLWTADFTGVLKVSLYENNGCNFTGGNTTSAILKYQSYNPLGTSVSLAATPDNINNEVDLDYTETSNGLVLYLPFEEGSGTTAQDWSGSENNATLNSIDYAYGKFGRGASLNNDNDYIRVTDIAGSTITAMGWYYYGGSGGGGWNTLFCRDGGSYHHVIINDANQEIGFYNNGWYSSGLALSTGQWYHIAIVKTGLNSKLYLNGHLIQDSNSSFDNDSYNLGIIGNFSTAGGQACHGVLDEVRVYNKALSHQEINAIALQGLRTFTLNSGTSNSAASISLIKTAENNSEFWDIDNFEGGPGSSDEWNSRNSYDPVINTTTSFSGSYSLYMPQPWGRNFEQNDQNVESGQTSPSGINTTDYPFLNMAYKIPSNTFANMLVHIAGIGWRSIALTACDNPAGSYPKVGQWMPVFVDDQWHFKTINIDETLDEYLGTGTHYIEAIIWHNNTNCGVSGSFYIDDFSASKYPLYASDEYADASATDQANPNTPSTPTVTGATSSSISVSYLDPGDNGTTHYFFAKPFDAIGNVSATSNTASATVVTGVSNYYVNETTGTVGGSASGWISPVTYTDNGLLPNTQYCYQVKARDGGYNEGSYSGQICAYTKAGCVASFTAVQNSCNSIQLFWSGGGWTSVRVTRDGQAGDEYIGNAYTHIDAGLTPGLTYTYRIYVRNIDGIEEALCETVLITVEGSPIASIGNSPISCAGANNGVANLSMSGGSVAIPLNHASLNSSLVSWVQSGSGAVFDAQGNIQQLTDLSGNNNHFVQGNSANRPQYINNVMNGHPVIRFNDSPATFLTSPNMVPGNYTIITVSKMINGVDSRLISSASTNWLMGYWGSYQDVYFAGGWVIGSVGPTPDNTAKIYSSSRNAGSYSLFKNGNLLASNSNGTASPGALQLNGWYGNNSEYSDGDIAEVIVYDRELTSEERLRVEKYLSNKYNITINNPDGYTYNWSNSSTAQDLSALNPGTYSVTVTDAMGCSTTASTVIEEGPAIPAVPSTSNTGPVCNASPVDVNATGLAPRGQFVTVGSGVHLSATPNIPMTGDWTVESWFQYPFANQSTFKTFFRGGVDDHHIIVENATELLGTFDNGGLGFVSSGYSLSNLLAGWHHIAAVGQGSNTVFYIDGVNVGQINFKTTESLRWIGSCCGTGTGQAAGAMDNVRVWNLARSSAQIRTDMFLDEPSVNTGLLANYKFENNLNSATGNYGLTIDGGSAVPVYSASNVYTYTWTGSGAPAASVNETQTISNPVSSNYYVVASNGYGCSGTSKSEAISVAASFAGGTISSSTTSICFDGDPAVITGAASGGLGANTFQREKQSYDNRYAIDFDGSNDYVEIANSADLRMGTGDFTYEFRMKLEAIQVNNTYFENGIWSAQTTLFRSNNANEINCYINGAGYSWSFSPNINQWYHLALQRESGVLKLFIDGSQHATTHINTADLQASNNMRIASSTHATGQHHNGWMDEFRIWNTALDATTLQAWDKKSINSTHPNYSNLKVYYPFDEGGSAYAADFARDNLGTLVNGPVWRENWLEIDGATATDYNPAIGEYTNNVKFRRAVNNNCGQVYSTVVDLEVKAELDKATAAYEVLSICTGDEVNLKVGGMAPGGQAIELNNATDAININGSINSNEVTGMMWYYYGGLGAGGWNTLFCRSGGTYHHILIEDATRLIGFYYGGGSNFNSSGVALNIGEWYHIAFTKSGTNQRIYLNGDMILESNASFLNSAGPIQVVGNHGFGANAQAGIGKIDEVRIFNSVLSQEEIKLNMYNEVPASLYSSMALYYKMEGKLNSETGSYNASPDGFTPTFSETDLFSYSWTGTNSPSLSSNITQITIGGASGNYVVKASNAACESSNSIALSVELDNTAHALSFDGAGDYVNTGSRNLGGSEITIEYWFKGSSLQSAIRQQNGGDYIVSGWGFTGLTAPPNQIHILSNDGGSGSGLAVGAAATDGNWHHVAMTWQQNTANGFKSYLDGQLIAQRNSSNIAIPNIQADVLLGSYQTSSEFTNGLLDEVRIWNKALTQTELQASMHSVLKNTDVLWDNLIAHYPMDEGAGTSIKDYSKNENTGTIVNATWLDLTPTQTSINGDNPICIDKTEQYDAVFGNANSRLYDYAWNSTGGGTINGVANNFDANITWATNGSINYSYSHSNNCNSETETENIVVRNPGPISTWDGSEDEDWHKDDNWSDCIPDKNTEAKIPSLVPNTPEIRAGKIGYAKSVENSQGILRIKTNAKLHVAEP